jgi:hypothetical protein
MAKKQTNAEISKRVLEIYTMLIKGYTLTDIRRYCRQAYDVVSNRTVDRYVKKATEIIQQENAENMNEIRANANARLNDVYKTLIKEGKYRDAVYCQIQINKINGLEQINLNHAGNIILNFSEKDKGLL